LSKESIVIVVIAALPVFGGFAIRAFLQVSNLVYLAPTMSMVPTINVGDSLVKTKVDNNRQSYENFDYPISHQDYYGKVIFIVPKVGLMLIPPYNYVSIAIAAGIFMAVAVVASRASMRNREK